MGPGAGSRREIHSAAMPEPIPIIGGTGALGWGLALRLAGSGQPVVIGSRERRAGDPGGGAAAKAAPSAEAEGLVNEEAARRGPIVFLTVPFRAQSENLNNLREALEPGQILVDCTVPTAAAVSGKATRSLGVWQGSAAQQAQEMVPDGVTVVAALHTVERADPRRPGGGARRGRPDLRRPQGRQGAGGRDRGAGPRPASRQRGPLEMARIVEQLTPLLISINARYKAHAGIRITGLGEGSPWE